MSLADACVDQRCVPRAGVFRILVCRPNHRLGNTLLLTPLIAELEQTYKGAEIDLLCEGRLAQEVFSQYFSVRNVFCLPCRGFKHPIGFLAMVKRVLATEYDLIVDPSVGSNFARILTRLLRGRYKLGFGDRVPGLTHAVPLSVAGRHMAHRPVNLLRWGDDCAAGGRAFAPLDIRLTEAERAQGRLVIERLIKQDGQGGNGPVVGLFANATGAKRYPMAWWRDFIVAFESSSPASTLVEFVPMHGRSMLGARLPAYYSSDIRRMGAVMAATNMVISSDSGVMHLAAASRVPTLGLFQVTDPDVYAPYGMGSQGVHTGNMTASEAARHAALALQSLPAPAGGSFGASPCVRPASG